MTTAFGSTFEGAPGYLNSATYGLPPQQTIEALERVQRQWRDGTLFPPALDADVEAVRRAFGTLVGVDPSSVAMGSVVSAMVGPVAAAIPDGSSVVVAEGEFTSVTFPFAAQAGRGVTVTEVPLDRLPEVAADHDVVAVATVQSADGALVDVADLSAATAGTDTLVVLDATQQLGWLGLDLSWADAVVGSSYKWLLSPRGVAWSAVSDRLADRLVPSAAGWWAGERPWESIYGLPLRLADDASRFDVSPAWFSVVGARASLDWLGGLDSDAVTAHCRQLARLTREALDLPPRESAIVSIPAAIEPEVVTGRLADAGLRVAVRGGAVRASFHLYNTEDDVDRLVEVLRTSG